MKAERTGIPVKEFAGLKPKMYSFLVVSSIEHKKVKGVNKNVFATIVTKSMKMFC